MLPHEVFGLSRNQKTIEKTGCMELNWLSLIGTSQMSLHTSPSLPFCVAIKSAHFPIVFFGRLLLSFTKLLRLSLIWERNTFKVLFCKVVLHLIAFLIREILGITQFELSTQSHGSWQNTFCILLGLCVLTEYFLPWIVHMSFYQYDPFARTLHVSKPDFLVTEGGSYVTDVNIEVQSPKKPMMLRCVRSS